GGALIAANESIGVNKAIEVANFVLQTACEKARAFNLNLFALFIQARNLGPVGAAGWESFARHRQAAFVVRAVISRHGLWNLRGLQHGVDNAAFMHVAFIIRAVIHKKTL